MKRHLTLFGLVAVFSLLLSAIWPCSATAAPSFTSLGQITHPGLRVPGAMDVGPSGNLYVADARSGKVHKFNRYGSLMQSFDLQASGRGIAVEASGSRIYVAREQAVVIADATSGAVLGNLAGFAANGGVEFQMAGDIDIDSVGNVYVADEGAMVIQIYDASGQYQTVIGGTGTSAGQFMQIGGMAINPADQVVVADSTNVNGKVHVFTLDPNHLNTLSVATYANSSAPNFGSPIMHIPRGVTFDGQGRGYFLEFMSSSVRVVDPAFSFLGAYTQAGHDVGQLNHVTGAAFDAANSRLFVGCDSGRVEIFGVDGGSNPVYVNHAPTTPVPQSPIGGSEVSSATPELVFENATDQDGDILTYQVLVKQAGETVFAADVPGGPNGTTSVAVAGVELAENATFSWTVQAFDADTSSAVSSSASFVVNAIDEAPSAPELLSPADSAIIDGTDLLSWSSSTDPDPNDSVGQYLLEIARDAMFSQVDAAQAVVAESVVLGELVDYAQLVDGSDYFWRVTAFDSDGVASEGNPVGQFSYDTTVLTVSANMPGVQVFMGGNHAYPGQLVGTVPLTLRDVEPGAISLVLKRSGFEPYVTALHLAERGNLEHRALLVPAMENVDLREKSRAINGKDGLAVSAQAAPFLVDFDADGMLDLLVGDEAGQVYLFADMVMSGRNRLDFSPGLTLSLPLLPGAVPFVVDWNNDGLKDLVIGSASGEVRLFLNQGQENAPAFGAGMLLATDAADINVGSAAAPAVIDYNSDGRKDLLVGNGAGQVQVFINAGTDAEPQLQPSSVLFEVGAPVVPMPIDWDADGQAEIVATAAGSSTVYRLQADGSYQAAAPVADGVFAVFPADLDGGKGKEVLTGGPNGQIGLWANTASTYLPSFVPAMQEKVDEVAGLVADEAPELLADVSAIGDLLAAGNFDGARVASEDLAGLLPAGAAQTAALELAALLN